MRAMSSRTLAVLILGWILGIVNALVTSTLITERKIINVGCYGQSMLNSSLRDG